MAKPLCGNGQSRSFLTCAFLIFCHLALVESTSSKFEPSSTKSDNTGSVIMPGLWKQITRLPSEVRANLVVGISRVFSRSTLAILLPLLLPCIWYFQKRLRPRDASRLAIEEPGAVSDTIGVGTSSPVSSMIDMAYFFLATSSQVEG